MAGKTIKVVLRAPHPQLTGLEHEFWVEDWWDKLTGGSWMFADGNPACMIYALRTGLGGAGKIPTDNEVVYGKINRLGHLLHVTELTEEVVDA
jgi:hypothetical protein